LGLKLDLMGDQESAVAQALAVMEYATAYDTGMSDATQFLDGSSFTQHQEHVFLSLVLMQM
jgi:hypothetical protein